MKIKAVVFDAYGTLFDVYSIQVLAESFYPSQGADIAIKWRDKQIEYTRLITQSDPHNVSGFQPNCSIPAGFDVDGFLTKAKENFVTMQDAWDRSDTSSLRQLMTDNMLNEIKAQITERDAASKVGRMSLTEVVSLDAKLLGIEESDDGYLASIEFTGMIREESNALPESFKEIWNMSRSKHDNSGWLLAGIQGF
jgi:predicted lipid-binding transport protein (Tim44 family)